MSDLSHLSLLDLFRMEADNQVGALTRGLLDLEEAPGNAALLAALMRAAHSLKGAARIVGLDALVSLTHAMEDTLTRTQQGQLTLGRGHIDSLLAASDLIGHLSGLADAELAAEMAVRGAELDALIVDLSAAPPARLTAPAPPPPPPPPPPMAAPVAPPVAPPDPVPALRSGAAPGVAPRTLRLDAQHLESLLGLAREAVLLNRRHGAQEDGLLRLRRQQQQLARQLLALQEGAAAAAWGGPLQQAREGLSACQALLEAQLEAQRDQSLHGHRVASRLYRQVNGVRMQPFGAPLGGLQRMVRDLAHALGKNVRLQILGERCLIDRDVQERIEAPLNHLLRNAIDHGIEPPEERVAAGKPACATLTLSARHARGQLEISVADDGRGIALAPLRAAIVERGLARAELLPGLSEAELLDFLFLPGFSTRQAVSEVSGRGVGLDVVQTSVQALGGRLRVDNRCGAGLGITLRLPLSLSLVRALLLRVDGEVYAMPLARIDRILRLPVAQLETLNGARHAWLDGAAVSVVSLARLLGLAEAAPVTELPLVLLAGADGRRWALAVDALLGQTELALQALDVRLGKQQDVAAAAVLDDGSPVLMLDVDDLANSLAAWAAAGAAQAAGSASAEASGGATPSALRRRVLVVEDSFAVREVERKLLAAAGYDVSVAVDGMDGWNALRAGHFDLVLTDIDMPRMTGIELLQQIRASERHRELPVMVVSYKEREADRLRGLQAGASHYFSKSQFDEASLLQAVADLIGAPAA
jgi:two-component system sensor histidine kinase and response regulator WspE